MNFKLPQQSKGLLLNYSNWLKMHFARPFKSWAFHKLTQVTDAPFPSKAKASLAHWTQDCVGSGLSWTGPSQVSGPVSPAYALRHSGYRCPARSSWGIALLCHSLAHKHPMFPLFLQNQACAQLGPQNPPPKASSFYYTFIFICVHVSQPHSPFTVPSHS